MMSSARPTSASRWGGCVLAGGRATRMGGLDKGLVSFCGYPLIIHVARRLAPQVDRVVISANRNAETYAALGYPVLADALPGFLGPLAGMHAALLAIGDNIDALVCVPCDSPEIPLDLAARLGAGIGCGRAAMVSVLGADEPAFAMLRADQADAIEAFLLRGERQLMRFLSEIDAVRVAFDDAPRAFGNLNTAEELASAEARARSMP